MTISLAWILPEPAEPDENGEVPWSEPDGEGRMVIGVKHVATGKFRALALDEFWALAQKEAQ